MKRLWNWKYFLFGAVLILLSSCILPSNDLGGGGDEDGGGLPPSLVLGRGYDIFGNYADTREVRAEVLSFDSLKQAGLIDERAVETSTFQTFTGKSIDEYSSQLAASVSVSGSYKAFFSGSVDTNFSSSTHSRVEYSYATVQNQIYKTELSLTNRRIDDLKSYLTDPARADINDPNVSPRDLFDVYGTHVLLSIYIGGRMDYNMAFNMSQISTTRSLSVMASASFGKAFASANIDTEIVSDQERNHFESEAQKRLNVYGGSVELGQNIIGDNDYQMWIASINDNPQFVGLPSSGALVAIWEFADDQTRAAELEAAFLEIVGETGVPTDGALTVEVELVKLHVVKEDENSDPPKGAELYGYLGFNGYTGSQLAFSGGRLWDVSSKNARGNSVRGGSDLNIDASTRHTFTTFVESTSFIHLYGHLREHDVLSTNEDLGSRSIDVYLDDGWNGFTQQRIRYQANKIEVDAIFTIKVIR